MRSVGREKEIGNKGHVNVYARWRERKNRKGGVSGRVSLLVRLRNSLSGQTEEGEKTNKRQS